MENHDRQHVAEVYTISQVTELTGVPENTIRSWERRFGLPEPDRTAGKQRRYTRSDVDLIRAIQSAREAGRTMDQAIADATSGSTARPAPVLQVVAAPEQPSPPKDDPGTDVLAEFARRLSATLTRLDLSEASRILSDSLLAVPVETLARHVLLAAADSLRTANLQGDLNQSTLLLAREWLERKLMAAYEASNPESGDIHALVLGFDHLTVPSMIHAYGIALSRGGFRTTIVNVGLDPTTARDLLDAIRPDCVVLHASSPDGHLARNGATRLIDGPVDERDWRGLLVHAGEVSSPGNISRAPTIGEDMLMVAQQLRQLLNTHNGTNRDST